MSASPERKLAAVMLADIAGFSSLMERDESGTFDRVRRLLSIHTHGLVRRIIDAGDRLNAAIAAEEALLRLVQQNPGSEELFNRWQESRRGVERAHREYDECVRKSADDPPFNLEDLAD